MTGAVEVYAARDSLGDKLRRRAMRLVERRSARLSFARPTVSFTFDDVPATAARIGAEILERHAARGSFYISAELCGRDGHMGRFADADEIRRLAQAGHEIGCHTFSHLDCGRSGAERIRADVARNTDAFAALGLEARTFAYPYGEVSMAAKRMLGQRFDALRTVRPGMVSGACDLNHLPAVGIEGPDGARRAERWLERAAASSAWLILFSHDVADQPSPYGCTPEGLERLVRGARARGFDILTLGQALTRGLEAQAARA